ncbi:response regulator transcription factor [Pedobacter boryungensis]|nr:response regulator [Pedobacter boryungensis]
MKKSIYVLEDEAVLRELFTYLLSQDGFQVSAYPNATTFHAALGQHDLPDMMLLDVCLPDGNGADICKELKSHKQTKDIPILIMSATDDLLSIKIESSADDHLEKPFDIDTFKEKTRKLASMTVRL